MTQILTIKTICEFACRRRQTRQLKQRSGTTLDESFVSNLIQQHSENGLVEKIPVCLSLPEPQLTCSISESHLSVDDLASEVATLAIGDDCTAQQRLSRYIGDSVIARLKALAIGDESSFRNSLSRQLGDKIISDFKALAIEDESSVQQSQLIGEQTP